MKLIVYTKADCPFCTKAKELLDYFQVEYETFDVSDDKERQEFYDDFGFESKQRTVPKLYCATDPNNVTLIGDYINLPQWLGENLGT